jgi:hypothetical protein
MPMKTSSEAVPSMLPAARAALDDYLGQSQGDVTDIRGLADSVYRAAVDDTMQALRVFSGVEDHLFRALKHCAEAERLMRDMHQWWSEMGDE